MSVLKRPDKIAGTTYRIPTGCGQMYITINTIDNKIYEVFVRLGKAGGCGSSQSEAIGRLTSLLLRNKVNIEKIIDELKGISCHSPAWHDGQSVLSCSDAVAKVLATLVEKPEAEVEAKVEVQSGGCPSCGGKLIFQEGCLHCEGCGYSKC